MEDQINLPFKKVVKKAKYDGGIFNLRIAYALLCDVNVTEAVQKMVDEG